AATGHDIGYWRFFPTPIEGTGIVPVWGYAQVTESRADGVEPGTRYYGFLPMAEQAVILPDSPRGRTLLDVSPGRVDLAAVYRTYVPVDDADPFRPILQPLIATSFLIADWLQENIYFGAQNVFVGSASSKTGLGLAACLSWAEPRPRIIGLTSARNVAFCKALGYYDDVITYEAVGDLPLAASVYVDMAGDAGVKRALHTRLGDHLKHSSAVGLSHWDKFAPPKDLPGPKPQFFFAPAQIAKRRENWGPGAVEAKIAEATARVGEDAQSWMTLREHRGLDAAVEVFGELVSGAADPTDGHVVTL
ncbi:MAG: DUF2855 family protein, partial [Pseudomonadota bacterium]